MIWDTFMFRNELDMLECRLTEFEDVPDVTHVLVESRMLHQGGDKPLYYADNRSRFDRWSDRIVHVVAEGLPTYEENPNPWVREQGQRNAAAPVIMDKADQSDVIILADLDEIPTLEAMHAMPVPKLAFEMGILGFAVDWVHPLRHRTSVSVLACAVDRSFADIREDGQRSKYPVVENGGWHISWLGGPDAIAEKAEAFCHLEFKDMIIEMNAKNELFGNGWTWFHNEEQQLVEWEDTWPRYIREGRAPLEWFRSFETGIKVRDRARS